MSSIPASAIVSVNPEVISGGGTGLVLSALVLTTNSRLSIGPAQMFPSAVGVQNFFGPTSDEALFANIYFGGFTNSDIKPGAILFAQYPMAATSAALWGGAIGLSLTALKALTGTLSFAVNGSLQTASAINLAAATSFSNAATILQASFSGLGCAIAYDSVSSAFVVTNTTTGSTSTLSYATGSLAATLGLTMATGARLSQGSIATTPEAFMSELTQATTNWATLATIFDPDNGSGNAQKEAFATWASQSNDRYAYVCWDGDITATMSNTATTSLGYLLGQSEQSGTILVWGQDYTKAAFICGWAASIDFTEHNGRATLAFRTQAGLSADVTNQTAMNNLIANGYNFYGAYATAAQGFVFMYPGSVSGDFTHAISYINQIWFNNALQLAMMELLTQMKSIPYNAAGDSLVRAAGMDPINQALNYGAIRTGVALSALQSAEVNAAAGLAIDQTLQNMGYYFQILPATAQVRAAGGSPPISIWYMDGGDILKLNLASILVQ